MLDISENNFEEILRAIRQAKAMIAFNSMRAAAAQSGYMSEEEINKENSAPHDGAPTGYGRCRPAVRENQKNLFHPVLGFQWRNSLTNALTR